MEININMKFSRIKDYYTKKSFKKYRNAIWNQVHSIGIQRSQVHRR